MMMILYLYPVSEIKVRRGRPKDIIQTAHIKLTIDLSEIDSGFHNAHCTL